MSFPLLKTGLIVDVNNLYYAVKRKYGPNRRLQMKAYVKHLESLGHLMVHKIAYSRQTADQSAGFVNVLKTDGWECHFGCTSWSIAMALRAADIAPNVDAFVLGTNFDEAGRILEWMRSRGKLTRCFALDIPGFFQQFGDCTEITEKLLSEPPKAA